MVTRDDVEAIKWHRLAAAQGDATAENNLGWSAAERAWNGGKPERSDRVV